MAVLCHEKLGTGPCVCHIAGSPPVCETVFKTVLLTDAEDTHGPDIRYVCKRRRNL
jgi:hypothetical protein